LAIVTFFVGGKCSNNAADSLEVERVEKTVLERFANQ